MTRVWSGLGSRSVSWLARPPSSEGVGQDRLPLAIALAWATFLLAALAQLAAVWSSVGGATAGIPGASDTTAPIIALLISGGGLCLALLAMTRAPAVAWLAGLLAATAATEVPIRIAGDLLPDSGPPDGPLWVPVATAVAICATASVAVAALYATRPSRGPRAWLQVGAWALVVGAALVCTARIVLVSDGIRGDDPATLGGLATLGVRSWLIIVLAVGALGLIADLRAPMSRARARIEASDPPPSPAVRAGIVFDELLGRAEGRRLAAEAERRRLAAELHADAMPALHRAMVGLESGRPAGEVASELRAVADDLEGAVTERRDPVLEALGLVTALERLAERVEDRGGPTVELRIDEVVSARPRPTPTSETPMLASAGPTGAPTTATATVAAAPAAAARTASATAAPSAAEAGLAPEDRPPRTIETAALRVATLSVDNAVRHAGASRIVVAVRATRDRLELTVDDDGAGLGQDAERAAARAGRHGLSEMRELAAEHGCRIEIGRSTTGGTRVALHWRA
jgi:signal transduction histidine kinase